jgi:hypothetical protein
MIPLPCSASESLTGRLIGIACGFSAGHTRSNTSLIAYTSPPLANSISLLRMSGISSLMLLRSLLADMFADGLPFAFPLVPLINGILLPIA